MIDAELSRKFIRVSCPYCNKVGTISVDQEVVNDGMLDRLDSLLTLHVFKDDLCEHEFRIVIDAHFKVRSALGSN